MHGLIEFYAQVTGMLDDYAQQRILAIAKIANNSKQALGYFRLAVGLFYLSQIMVDKEIDFDPLHRQYNQFINSSIGAGHSITSILQFMSGERVMAVVHSERFMHAFMDNFGIPFHHIPLMLLVNLEVSKNISKIGIEGPLHRWIVDQQARISRVQHSVNKQVGSDSHAG
ncbi:MAG: hypothetical protein V4695_06470 [Pseudomonadota bacterium]